MLDCTQPCVSQWFTRKVPFYIAYCLEKRLGIPLNLTRPDLEEPAA
jgi:hypothetical protein